ncbi:hypothetical protein T03_16566 [Trichinella britovi]|uniref:Uncharacterized protein n=1 Tax=Trichinella britovi TaxID=45882 RepID=A0A0V1DAZ3_TRIBR|nr:hypothetical protein T03_16566 [Trichinella britovi]
MYRLSAFNSRGMCVPATCHFCSYIRRCFIILRNRLKAAVNNITDRLPICTSVSGAFFLKYHDYSIYFMHYVFTRILRHSRAVLDHASMKAEILHFQTCPNRLICLEQASGITGPVLPISRDYLASQFGCRYHYCYVWDFCPRFDFTNFDVSTTRLEAAGPRFGDK